MANKSLHPLFHRIYNINFKTARRVLQRIYLDDDYASITKEEIEEIIRENAYPYIKDPALEKYPEKAEEELNALVEDTFNSMQDWQIIKKDLYDLDSENKYTSELAQVCRPQTTLEKRWLCTIAQDKLFRLFLEEEHFQALQDAMADQKLTPLYNSSSFVIYDQFQDGDQFSSEDEIHRFRTILKAIRNKRSLVLKYQPRKEKHKDQVKTHTGVIPIKLEYSPKNNRFRLLAAIRQKKEQCPDRNPQKAVLFRRIFNLSNIIDCTIEDAPTINEYERACEIVNNPEQRTTVIHIVDSRNALQRAMLAFSDYQKKVRHLEEKCLSGVVYERERQVVGPKAEAGFDVYEITLTYLALDEKELVIRILSMGHLAKVIEGQTIIDDIKNRIKKQMALRKPQK